MKMILLAVVPFVIGLAGATGIAVMNAPPPDSAADSTHVAAGEHGGVVPGVPDHGSGHAEDPVSDAGHDAAAAAGDQENPAAHATDASGPALQAATAAPGASAEAGADSGFAAAGIARLSRILVNMKPKEAAQILAHLSDDEVDAILKAVGVRQAAALLTELPRERGAALSRRLIDASGVQP